MRCTPAAFAASTPARLWAVSSGPDRREQEHAVHARERRRQGRGLGEVAHHVRCASRQGCAALAADRDMTRGSTPLARRRATTAEPTVPVPPTTSTFIVRASWM